MAPSPFGDLRHRVGACPGSSRLPGPQVAILAAVRPALIALGEGQDLFAVDNNGILVGLDADPRPALLCSPEDNPDIPGYGAQPHPFAFAQT